MTYDEMIAVIQAHKDGKKIQVKSRKNDVWYSSFNNQPSWNFSEFEYRVKPKPLVLWINEYEDGKIYHHRSELDALKWAGNQHECKRAAVKMVEAKD